MDFAKLPGGSNPVWGPRAYRERTKAEKAKAGLTDAPYLAPVPMRGKRNEPAFVVHTAAAMAELKGVTADELARATTDNFFRLFTKATRPQ